MPEYNSLVTQSFSNPKYVLGDEQGQSEMFTAEAGEREKGVWYRLSYDAPAHTLYYKVYGSPYAIAAVEWLAGEVAEKRFEPGQNLDLESTRQLLDMPYPYMNILLTLEDAWTALSSKTIA